MLENKVIAITGASGGVGAELCLKLAKKGAKLVIGSNDAVKMQILKDQLKNLNCDFLDTILDVTEENQVKSFIESAVKKYGKIDMLFNLAGLSIPGQISEFDLDKYDTTMDVNLKGTFLCSKHFVALHDAEEDGLIVNIGSMAAKRANGNAPLYCVAKASVNMFSKGLAIQCQAKNIRVTTVNPGGADTDFWGTRQVDRSKLMKAEDIADVLVFIGDNSDKVVIHEIDFEAFNK